LETLTNCPTCQNTAFQDFLTVEDYTVSHEKFSIQKCISCEFLFTNPRPSETEIGKYYESQDYISHHDDSENLMSRVYTSVRDFTIQQKIKLINKHANRKGNLLDIGSGTGAFASAIKNDGWNVYGTEPDSGARKVASERIGDTVFEDIYQSQLSTRTFQTVTMWHVLEHVHRLNETLDWLYQHLETEGLLVVAVPNPESADASKFNKHWAAYDVPRHLYHFTKSTMKLLMTNHGFEVKQTLPMWFDSFYVSMLSTKYQQSKINLVDSILTGLSSNLKGRSSGSKEINTSSIIYIIKKK
jgi:2-polyprenyl-3-methyl-5-hydroxy-6-metoxy-1,4-benzoquinol methylase